MSDRSRAEGRGIRVGNFELHPGIGAEIGYDSNVFLSEDPRSSAILRVGPWLYLSTLTSERMGATTAPLSFRAGVSGSLRHYFATSAGTDVGLGQDAKLTWVASPVFQLELFEEFKRSITPFTEAGGLGDSQGQGIDFGRDQLGGGTRLQLSTPGGLLKGGLGYRIDWDYFEGDEFRGNDSLTHTISADTSWEFFPKTALFWNGAVKLAGYLHEQDAAIGERNDSTAVYTKIGLNGAVTPRLSFTIATGYDATFFSNDVDGEAVLAQIEARWRFLEAAQWSLGYDRTLTPSFFGNYVRGDRIKTRLQAMFWAKLVLGASAEVSFVKFGQDSELGGDRSDTRFAANINGEYRIVDWFAITADVGYVQNFSDYVTTIQLSPTATIEDEARYKQFEAWIGVRAFM